MRPTRLLVVAGVLAALAPFPSGPASASCAAPSLDVARGAVLGTGATLEVEGRGFVDGCRDAMSCPAYGCDECTYDDPPPAPLVDVALTLVQDGRRWELGTADAGTAEEGRAGQVSWSVTLPRAVRTGPARLVADGTTGVPVVLQEGRTGR